MTLIKFRFPHIYDASMGNSMQVFPCLGFKVLFDTASHCGSLHSFKAKASSTGHRGGALISITGVSIACDGKEFFSTSKGQRHSMGALAFNRVL